MTYSNLIKTGLGVGLLAVSLGVGSTALDGKHNFGSTMIYVRSSTTGTNYTAFLPSGNKSTDSVIVVEHLQGTTATSPMTWTYMLPVATLDGLSNASSTNIPTGSLIGSIFSPSSATWTVQTSKNPTDSASVNAFRYDSQGMGFVISNTQGTIGSSFSDMVFDIASPIAYPFSYPTSVSSSQCNVTAVAVIDGNDYLQWGGIVVNAVGYHSVTSPALGTPNNVSVVWTSATKSSSGSGAGSSYTTTSYNQYMSTYSQEAWNALQTNSASFSSFPTNATVIMYAGTSAATAFSLPFDTASQSGLSTVAIVIGTQSGTATTPAVNKAFATGYYTAPATMLKAQTACNSAYTARAALNTTNLLIGGRNGLMRLW